ncbi:MAG: endonuclease Q family protein [Syntrophomonadaceae bacterium]
MPIRSDRDLFADLHIHIGRAGGRPVKITAARSLTLRSIIFEDAPRKGLDIVGVVDAGSPLVTTEIEDMLQVGDLRQLDRGGFLSRNGILLITGSEVETREGVHALAYLPDLESLYKWQRFLVPHIRNMSLSTQKMDLPMADIIGQCVSLEGIFCLAHAFTPHKGAYGAWTDRLFKELGPVTEDIKVIELGLSSDSCLADTLAETRRFQYLSNSDAHSAANIAREYNRLAMAERNFTELRLALWGIQGRRITANYGLHPRMGKYHRSYCPSCGRIAVEPPPVTRCPACGNGRLVMGVYDRIVMIQDTPCHRHPPDRPPYHYRIPLKDLPGIGPVTYHRLLEAFANEIGIMEMVPVEDIRRTAGERPAAAIQAMRSGSLVITDGGGGYYGRVSIPSDMI